MTNFTSANCLGSCNPPQILSLTYAISDITSISIYGMCDKYDTSQLQYSYSIDGLCWTCYMSYDECLANTIELESDFYIKIKVNGDICKVQIWDEDTLEYNTQLDQGFNFTSETNANTYNPYANLESAIELQQQLAENVSTIVGIPIYYFKLSPNTGSKDITFKEYALMDVEAVKQIKLVIADGQMPSSRPEFADWGMDFQTDWETEVTKQSFATAFGINAQPMEGDLIYIPMMKRMWMVNSAYEEKNTGFMWQATTFKLMLTKYQEKGSVDLGDTEAMVNSFVKNKYEDLFGSDDNGTVDSGEASLDAPKYAANYLYPIFESDATRKYITCDSLEIENNDLYYRGTLISDSKYTFLRNDIESKIIYQKGICGDEYTCSFIINIMHGYYEGTIISIGQVKLNIKQDGMNATLSINLDNNSKLELPSQNTYICIFKVSKCLNIVSLEAYRYVYNKDIPLYKLQKIHYWFDMNQPISTYVSKYNIEYLLEEKSEVYISNLNGYITNFKLFDIYEDNLMDLLQMYPTHQHLIINDTARKIVGLPGATS
jgi:uncharacterized protein YuzE